MLPSDRHMKAGDEMHGAILPGNSTAEIRSYAVPQPCWGQVLLRMKSSTICGSDIAPSIASTWEKGPNDTRESLQGTNLAGRSCKQDQVAGVSP